MPFMSLNSQKLFKWGAWGLLLLEQGMVAIFLATLSHETRKLIKIEFGDYHPELLAGMGIGFWTQFSFLFLIFLLPLFVVLQLREKFSFLLMFLGATVGWLLILIPMVIIIVWPLVYVYVCKY